MGTNFEAIEIHPN